MSKKVIDVSEHNGTINWSKVKGNCDGVIIRLGYRGYSGGKLATDPQWTANVYGAERHDIPMGVYWYTQAITEAEAREEAAYCVQLLTGHQLAYPVYLDLEYSSSGAVPGINHATDISHWYASYGSAATPASKPDYIKTFQGWLGVTADGIYGPTTRKAAIKRLQTLLNNLYDCGLAVDGIFGPKTKAVCGSLRRGSGGSIVYLIQGLLYCHGYDPGGLDYAFGPKTEAAVIAFQQANGLAADGIVGPKTWAKLAA